MTEFGLNIFVDVRMIVDTIETRECLEVSVLKNLAECLGQRVKWTFGARVLIVAFVDRCFVRSLARSFERQTNKITTRPPDVRLTL